MVNRFKEADSLLQNQISELFMSMQTVNSRTLKFFKQMKQLVFDHYSWLKGQKTKLSICVGKDGQTNNDTSLMQDQNILNMSTAKPLDVSSVHYSSEVKKERSSKALHSKRSKVEVNVNCVEDSENFRASLMAN